MLRILSMCVLLLAAVPALGGSSRQAGAGGGARPAVHTFAADGDHFVLDGKPFKVLSGELHYARIPREYWHARLKMAKAMGLNTVATYVFWNVHEPSPGRYEFSGQNDLAAFVRAAQEEGLYVILRSGPYACAEWDLGGLPAWLLADAKSAGAIRSNSPEFLGPAGRWISRLSQEVLPLQVGRGGPILMTQIENEYGQFGDDHAYIAALRELYAKAGFNGRDSLLYTADNWRHIPEGSLAGLFASVNFGINNHQGGMDALARARPGQALFASEYWPGWFDHWGHPHETRPIGPQIEDIDYILTRGAGINIYMFHGGTSFGFMAGSSLINGKFLPDVTSYDYDAPLDESGRATPKYFAYRKELAKWSACGSEACLPAVPPSEAILAIPKIAFHEAAPLFENLPQSIASPLLGPMERFGQSFGYILYRTQLPDAAKGDLVIDGVHDFAAVYIDAAPVGTADRRDAGPDGTLPPLRVNVSGAGRLDVLVANDGRINVDHAMRTETKGIGGVTFAGGPLSGWSVYPLPMTTLPDSYRASAFPVAARALPVEERPIWSERPPVPMAKATYPPAFFHARFTLKTTGDTFLDTSHLGKGVAWVNGHNLGRFWNAGPQQTLYVPGPWLKAGSNELVIFDMLPTGDESVRGLDHPILDAPVASAARSQQE